MNVQNVVCKKLIRDSILVRTLQHAGLPRRPGLHREDETLTTLYGWLNDRLNATKAISQLTR